MTDEINFKEKYDKILDIQPIAKERDKVKGDVKFDYIGLEIEIAVEFQRDRYTFIRALIKKIKNLVGKNGVFVRDATILGSYSFEIVLNPLPIKKIGNIYSNLMKILAFSDGSLQFNKEHNCGLHMNFNQYDIKNIKQTHKDLLLFMSQKQEYFEENIYKRVHYDFDFDQYLEYQKTISSKYLAINYLNKKLIEIRNIKVELTKKELMDLMKYIINIFYPNKLIIKKKIKRIQKLKTILSDTFQKNNINDIKKSLDNKLLIIKFEKNIPKIILPDENIISYIEDREEN